jgi:hypothetical protein
LLGDDSQFLRNGRYEQIGLCAIRRGAKLSEEVGIAGERHALEIDARRRYLPRVDPRYEVASLEEHCRDGAAGGTAYTGNEDACQRDYPMREKLARTTSKASA